VSVWLVYVSDNTSGPTELNGGELEGLDLSNKVLVLVARGYNNITRVVGL